MRIKIHKKIKLKKGLVVVPIYKDQLRKLPGILPKPVNDFISDRIKHRQFEGKNREVLATFLSVSRFPEGLLLVGLGRAGKFNAKKSRELGGKIGQHVKKHKTKELTVILNENLSESLEELLEGILMAQYKVDQFKSKKEKDAAELKEIDLVIENKGKAIDETIYKAGLIVHGLNFIKDLVNSPSNIVNAEYLAREAKRIARENRYKIVVLGNSQLVKLKAGGILAVNQGSKNDAKLIVLQYDGGKRGEKPIVLVGKGVIFDTGGYNLKPTNAIEDMHQDMAGGATVLGIFEILKKLGVKKNVVGIVPAVENLISEKAYRPSDIITMLSGKTVEITNTDAEGRMILADAITYGTKFEPQSLVTIATLTGAVAVALGNRYAGLMGNDPRLRRALQKAGRTVDDLGWPLPIHGDYRKKMKSGIADIRNYDLGTGRYGGSEKGAAFLENFVEKNKWCHIDIGGTAFTDDPKEYEIKGSTGHGFRMLVRWLEDF